MNFKKEGESHMNNMKVYKVYLEDTVTEDCFKTIIPAFSEELAMEYAYGNGEIVAIKETTDYSISNAKLYNTLKNAGYGKAEISIITRALSSIGLTY